MVVPGGISAKEIAPCLPSFASADAVRAHVSKNEQLTLWNSTKLKPDCNRTLRSFGASWILSMCTTFNNPIRCTTNVLLCTSIRLLLASFPRAYPIDVQSYRSYRWRSRKWPIWLYPRYRPLRNRKSPFAPHSCTIRTNRTRGCDAPTGCVRGQPYQAPGKPGNSRPASALPHGLRRTPPPNSAPANSENFSRLPPIRQTQEWAGSCGNSLRYANLGAARIRRRSGRVTHLPQVANGPR